MKFSAVVVVVVSLALLVATVCADGPDFGYGDVDFSLAFYKHAYSNGSNLVVSPVSIRLAFTVIYQAAQSGAASALQKAFYLPAEKATALGNVVKFVKTVEESPYVNVSYKVLKVATPFSAGFGDAIAQVFHGTADVVNFDDKAAIVDRANRWASEVSHGKIQKHLDEDDIDTNMELLVLNALVLKAIWAQPFADDETFRGEFHFLNGVREVDLMQGTLQVLQRRTADYEAIQMPYSEESDLTMWVLLPNRRATLETLLEQLTPELFEDMETAAKPRHLEVTLPKFSVRSKLDAKNVLMHMGWSQLFIGNDYTFFDGHRSSVTHLKQSAFIKVDESGTEAAAITSTGARGRTLIPSFTATRPFLFVIKKISTDTIVFMGHYSHYEQTEDADADA